LVLGPLLKVAVVVAPCVQACIAAPGCMERQGRPAPVLRGHGAGSKVCAVFCRFPEGGGRRRVSSNQFGKFFSFFVECSRVFGVFCVRQRHCVLELVSWLVIIFFVRNLFWLCGVRVRDTVRVHIPLLRPAHLNCPHYYYCNTVLLLLYSILSHDCCAIIQLPPPLLCCQLLYLYAIQHNYTIIYNYNIGDNGNISCEGKGQ